MLCLTPITVRRDTESESVVPCGNCYACRSNMRNEWSIRLKRELADSKGGLFLTLTYSDENLRFTEYFNSDTGEVTPKWFADKRDIQLFMKRIRKKFGNESFRYFAVPEYGEDTQRPHWHMLLFFCIDIIMDSVLYDFLSDSWSLGFVYFGNIEDASIHYVTKYVLKGSKLPLGINDIRILCSRRPAIGYKIFDDALKQNLDNRNFSSYSFHGNKSRLPRLYREKLRNLIDEEEYEDLSLSNRREQSYRLLDMFYKSKYKNFNDFIDFKRAAALRHAEIVMSHQSKHNKI